jgi:hypothetical protein
MMVSAFVDFSLAFGQCALALLLWHQAEPRMREQRGPWQSMCIVALGFVLAWSAPLAYQRGFTSDPLDWQRTMRDVALLIYAVCRYRYAMSLPKIAEGRT